MMSNSESRKRQSERAAGELVADVDTLAAAVVRIMLANTDATPRKLAEALVAAGFGNIDAARREIAEAERRGAERALREAADDWRVQATSERTTRGNVGQVLLVVGDDLCARADRLGATS